MINRIISNKFFEDTQLITDILNHEIDELVTHGESEFSTPEWVAYNKPYLEAIKIATKYVTQLEEDYGCAGKELDGVWVRRNIDTWELKDHEKHERNNADIHKDYFNDYSKVINLQVYLSDDVPPEAGTCFWEYTGSNLEEDIMPGEDAIAKWPYNNWSLLEQIPFDQNVAFTYNAGPDGVWHSAPLTDTMLEQQTPDHKREVMIFRFRYK